MSKFKNALTEYYIANMPEGSAEPDYKRFAKWISEVTDDTDETVDSQAYYDGDGTEEDEVTGIKLQYGFSGIFDASDEAHALVASKKLALGDGRKLMLKIVHTDGMIYEGPATISNIKTTGGAASDHAPIECTIAYNRVPEVTEPVAPTEPVETPQG